MILVDTNVVSETMRRAPDARVIEWFDAQSPGSVYLSAVSLAELLFGIALLPDGRRKQALDAGLGDRLAALFGENVLPFDSEAARAYARIVAEARQAGVAIGVADGQIAATAAANNLVIASRDTAPFRAAGLAVIDPWTAATLD